MRCALDKSSEIDLAARTVSNQHAFTYEIEVVSMATCAMKLSKQLSVVCFCVCAEKQKTDFCIGLLT